MPTPISGWGTVADILQLTYASLALLAGGALYILWRLIDGAMRPPPARWGWARLCRWALRLLINVLVACALFVGLVGLYLAL